MAALASLGGSLPGPPRSLGGAPLCEASAILPIPCPGREDAACWLVGDNEVRDRLFLFEMDADGSPRVASRRPLMIGDLLGNDRQLSDIEALARLRDGEILVYGSHGRNKRCETKRKRRRYLGLRVEQRGREAVAGPGRVGLVDAGRKLDWRQAFGPEPGATLARLQAAVLAADDAAANGDCRQAFDLEAAVVVPTPAGDAVWLGLRAPLLGDDAVLVRHELSAGTLRFVEARRVVTGGAGIRALARHASSDGGWIYGLSAEPGGGEDGEFRLWRFHESLLGIPRTSDAIQIESVSPAAARSEGLGITTGTATPVAIVVQDGEQGSSPATCERDASYQRIELSRD